MSPLRPEAGASFKIERNSFGLIAALRNKLSRSRASSIQTRPTCAALQEVFDVCLHLYYEHRSTPEGKGWIYESSGKEA